jgi:hypothetical protein
MAAPDVMKSWEKPAEAQLPPLVRGYTRCAATSLLVKHLMDKGDGNRSFANG